MQGTLNLVYHISRLPYNPDSLSDIVYEDALHQHDSQFSFKLIWTIRCFETHMNQAKGLRTKR